MQTIKMKSKNNYLSVFPVGDAWRNLPLLLLFYCHLQHRNQCLLKRSSYITQHFWLENLSALKTWRQKCYLSAGGMHDRSRWWRRPARNLLIDPETQFYPLKFCRYEQKNKAWTNFADLNRGGSIGSFCISTMRMTLCLAPELKATPCWDGVYLWMTRTGNG